MADELRRLLALAMEQEGNEMENPLEVAADVPRSLHRRQSISLQNSKYIISYFVDPTQNVLTVSLTDSATEVLCTKRFTQAELRDCGFPSGDFENVKKFLDAVTKIDTDLSVAAAAAGGDEQKSSSASVSGMGYNVTLRSVDNEGTHASIELKRNDVIFPWVAVIDLPPAQSDKQNELLHAIIDDLKSENRLLRLSVTPLKKETTDEDETKSAIFDPSAENLQQMLESNNLVAEISRVPGGDNTVAFRVKFTSITHGCKLWVGTIRIQNFPTHILVLTRCGFDSSMIKTSDAIKKLQMVNDWNTEDVYHTSAIDSDGDIRLDRIFEVPKGLTFEAIKRFFDGVITHFVVSVDQLIDVITGEEKTNGASAAAAAAAAGAIINKQKSKASSDGGDSDKANGDVGNDSDDDDDDNPLRALIERIAAAAAEAEVGDDNNNDNNDNNNEAAAADNSAVNDAAPPNNVANIGEPSNM